MQSEQQRAKCDCKPLVAKYSQIRKRADKSTTGLPSQLVCKYSRARTMTGNSALEVASVDAQWKEIEISCTVAIMVPTDTPNDECAIV